MTKTKNFPGLQREYNEGRQGISVTTRADEQLFLGFPETTIPSLRAEIHNFFWCAEHI